MHTPIPFLPQQPYDQKGQGVKPFPLELVNLIPSGQPPFEEWELPPAVSDDAVRSNAGS
jgi:hypothetical protein